MTSTTSIYCYPKHKFRVIPKFLRSVQAVMKQFWGCPAAITSPSSSPKLPSEICSRRIDSLYKTWFWMKTLRTIFKGLRPRFHPISWKGNSNCWSRFRDQMQIRCTRAEANSRLSWSIWRRETWWRCEVRAANWCSSAGDSSWTTRRTSFTAIGSSSSAQAQASHLTSRSCSTQPNKTRKLLTSATNWL